VGAPDIKRPVRRSMCAASAFSLSGSKLVSGTRERQLEEQLQLYHSTKWEKEKQ
jgi:hypothetical protein